MAGKRMFTLKGPDIFIADLPAKDSRIPPSSRLEEAFYLLTLDKPDVARETLFNFIRWIEMETGHRKLLDQAKKLSKVTTDWQRHSGTLSGNQAEAAQQIEDMTTDPWQYFGEKQSARHGRDEHTARSLYIKSSAVLSQAVSDGTITLAAQNLFLAKLALSTEVKNETYLSYLEEALDYLRASYGLHFWENDLEDLKANQSAFEEWQAQRVIDARDLPENMELLADPEVQNPAARARIVIRNNHLIDVYFHKAMVTALDAYWAMSEALENARRGGGMPSGDQSLTLH